MTKTTPLPRSYPTTYAELEAMLKEKLTPLGVYFSIRVETTVYHDGERKVEIRAYADNEAMKARVPEAGRGGWTPSVNSFKLAWYEACKRFGISSNEPAASMESINPISADSEVAVA
jgi:hypothetical protein